MGNLTVGTKLTPSTRRAVLSSYVYRPTIENGYPKHNPCQARVAAITDQQWLSEHAFYTNNDGRLDQRYRYCEPSFLAE